MTELYIDGVSAVLPKDFSVQVKRENPLFTKNGEYTYDITLPLTNATNANLYTATVPKSSQDGQMRAWTYR